MTPEDEQAAKDVWGRVAMAPGCFSSVASSTGQNNVCNYLDSQYKIEANLPSAAIVRTEVTVTCPLVSVNGQAVGP
jgi:hypothetical protein